MIVVKWTGKTISENKRLALGKVRMYSPTEYKAFVDSIAWTIKQQCPAVKYEKINLVIGVKINNWKDAHNLSKPIKDALQRSGIIRNDKNIAWDLMMPPERHNGLEPDEIVLMIGEVK